MNANERAARANKIQQSKGCPYCVDSKFFGLLPAENGIHHDIHKVGPYIGVSCKNAESGK